MVYTALKFQVTFNNFKEGYTIFNFFNEWHKLKYAALRVHFNKIFFLDVDWDCVHCNGLSEL